MRLPMKPGLAWTPDFPASASQVGWQLFASMPNSEAWHVLTCRPTLNPKVVGQNGGEVQMPRDQLAAEKREYF